MGTVQAGGRPSPTLQGGFFMLSSRRLAQCAVLGLAVAVVVWGIAAQPRAGDAQKRAEDQKREAELKAKQEQQKLVQEETDKLVSRLNASLRLLTYYKLDKNQEAEILQDVTKKLTSLSADQMAKVIEGLGKAA